MKPRYDLIIFDLDGTLADTAPDIAASANWTLKQTGFPERTLSEVKHAVGRGIHELLTELMNLPGGDPKPAPLVGDALNRACEIYREHYVAHMVVHSRPYAGVIEMLRGPLAGVPKAVVTNKPHVLTPQILKELGLNGFFDPVIGSGGLYPAKPAPDGVDAARVQHGARKERTILIGDSEVDRQTAASAGIRFGWVTYGYDTVTRDGSFDVFENPYQWEELINGNV